jgi:transposase
MSSKELKRLGVLARVEKEALNLVNAAEILGLSYRQTKRIWRRYQDEGEEGLQHRSVGRESGRSKPKKFRVKVLRLYAGNTQVRLANDSGLRWPPNI